MTYTFKGQYISSNDHELHLRIEDGSENDGAEVVLYFGKMVRWEKEFLLKDVRRDQAMEAAATKGGIDFNSANLNLRIKRDGNGMPLPLAQQDLAQLSNIQGLDPVILSIKPASQTALFSQLVGNL